MLKRLTKLPPTAAETSAPTCSRLKPSAATLSRSIWISVCGWSNFVSMIGGNQNCSVGSVRRLLLELLREFQDPLRLRRGRQHELDRERAAAGKRGRHHREDVDPGDLGELLLGFREDLECGALPLVPGLQDAAAEAGGRER